MSISSSVTTTCLMSAIESRAAMAFFPSPGCFLIAAMMCQWQQPPGVTLIDVAVTLAYADNALTGEDESAIRGLLELYGKNDSLGYFATRRDKAVVFAPTGRAAITYRVEVGVCLASGDPVGDPKAWPQAIQAWLTLCEEYGWAPGVMGASSTAALKCSSA